MPSAAEELARLSWLIKEGQIMPEEPCKLILPRTEARQRVKNDGPKPKTRLIRELDVPENYSAFNREFDRFIEHSGGNPQIAYSIMLRCLAQLSDEDIKRLAEQGV